MHQPALPFAASHPALLCGMALALTMGVMQATASAFDWSGQGGTYFPAGSVEEAQADWANKASTIRPTYLALSLAVRTLALFGGIGLIKAS